MGLEGEFASYDPLRRLLDSEKVKSLHERLQIRQQDEVEKYEILTDRPIDALLDATPGLIEWTDENKVAMQAYDEMNRRILARVRGEEE